MKTETKQQAGRASRIVAMAAVAALGVGTLSAPALATQDDGRMVEENALLLNGDVVGIGEHGFYVDFAGFGEHGFYVDPAVFLNVLKAPYVLFQQALVAPVALLGGLGDIFPREGYREQ